MWDSSLYPYIEVGEPVESSNLYDATDTASLSHVSGRGLIVPQKQAPGQQLDWFAT